MGKKRKRHADGGAPKPSKKVVTKTPSSTANIKISLVQDIENWGPIVASTPGLAFPNSITLQTYSKRRKNAPQRPGRSGTIATEEFLLHSSEHPKLDYTAREEEAGGADSLLKHYVGVYDPASGKLEVMEARKMTIRGIVRSHEAAPEALTEREHIKNMRDLRNDLGQTFGTKKARKAIASITENAISPSKAARQTSPGGTQRTKIDSVTTAMLASIGEVTADMSTREQLQAAADEGKPRPKANMAAEHVKDVYTIISLIGRDPMQALKVKQWRDAATNNNEVITKSRYVSNRINKVFKDAEKLKVLRYLLCLLEFFGATRLRGKMRRTVASKDELRAAVEASETVVEGIRRKFSDKGEMSKFHTDLLITHVCALALIVDNFEVDTYDLREDLKLEVKDIKQYFLEVGARVAPANEKQRQALGLDKAAAAQRLFAKLKLPLEFPKTRYARKT